MIRLNNTLLASSLHYRKITGKYTIKIIDKIIIIIIIITGIELSLGGSSPYTSTNKNKYIHVKTKQYKKHSTNNTKHNFFQQ